MLASLTDWLDSVTGANALAALLVQTYKRTNGTMEQREKPPRNESFTQRANALAALLVQTYKRTKAQKHKSTKVCLLRSQTGSTR